MIRKIDMGDYILVKSDTGKLKVKGDEAVYSEATELKDKPREYEEVLPEAEEPMEEPNDNQNEQGLPSEVGEGETPVESEPHEEAGE